MKNLGWTKISLRDRMRQGASWLPPHARAGAGRPRAPGRDDPEPRRPSLNQKGVRDAFLRYRNGEDAAGSELLALLFRVRDSWAGSLSWYKGASWDRAHDAVLDGILDLHAKAREPLDEKGRMLKLPARGLRAFVYRRIQQQYWRLRRHAHETSEKRRDRTAQQGDAADPFLPRIVCDSERLANHPAPGLPKRVFDELVLKAFFKLPSRKRAMALAHFEGIPYEEIAQMTGTTERAARVHVSTLLARLRTSLGIEKTKAPLNKKTVGRA
jgi:RNA polymerase sigma factor (sigma-70 family)